MTPEQLRTLDVDALLNLRKSIDLLLTEKRQELQQILRKIDSDLTVVRPEPLASAGPSKQRQLSAQFQSKRDPRLRWAGRGMMPRWMRDEMKGTKLNKEDFRISD